ncbi:MAG: DUF2591 domain-containing protein [bacterium]|nr:DUF2591 domain-containing protein [bacterium]
MTDYNKMTDFEINKLVAESLGFSDPNEEYDGTIDYCNSWNDIGPIIKEYKISINYLPCTNHWSACDGHDSQIYAIEKDSPKRAAAIVFLKMTQTKDKR